MGSTHTHPPVRRLHPGISTFVGGTALVGALAHLTVPDSGPLVVAAHATAGWWWVATLVGLGLGVALRDRIGIGLCGLATLATLAWTLPGSFGGAPGGDPQLRVAVANVLSSNPEIDRLLDDLAAEDPDVVAIIEVPPDLDLDRFDPARWPVRGVLPREDNFGIALLARDGATPVETVSVAGIPWMRAEIAIDGRSVEVIAGHTLPPVRALNHRVWVEQLTWLATRQTDGAHRVVLADLNVTRHNPTFTTLHGVGLRDALADVGRAGARTWTPWRAGPDLLRLDHVLISPGLATTEIRVLPRRGSDHRAVRADLFLR